MKCFVLEISYYKIAIPVTKESSAFIGCLGEAFRLDSKYINGVYKTVLDAEQAIKITIEDVIIHTPLVETPVVEATPADPTVVKSPLDENVPF